MDLGLRDTPYSLDPEAAIGLAEHVRAIEDRVVLLRSTGRLSDRTLSDYYGQTRFEQVAESNALEGSTLSAGETELAILKGITITGHDPAYVRDARALDKALNRAAELARDRTAATDIAQLLEIHALLMGDRPGAGMFRNEAVAIRGSRHVPPKDWKRVMDMMEQWESWSKTRADLPAPLRSTVLHAWLTHVHPFVDGNGRAARAIGNLELIRAGYPPIILRRTQDRDRYLDCLGESDAGNIAPFAELVLERVEGALTALERAAVRMQGYDPVAERIRARQERDLKIWSTAVKLLAEVLEREVSVRLESSGGRCVVRSYPDSLGLDEYLQLCEGRAISKSWAFETSLEVPGLPRLVKLAWMGFRSRPMQEHLNGEGGPALLWSSPNPKGYPKWIADGVESPYGEEIAARAGNGDEWHVRLPDGAIERHTTMELAGRIADALVERLA